MREREDKKRAHNLRERYAELVEAKLRKDLVLKDGVVFNNDYEGDAKAGAVKVPVRDTEVQVSDYNKASGISASTGSTTYDTMLINKDKAVNEVIDGFDAEAVPDNLVADRLDSASYSLASTLDSDGGVTLVAGATPFGASTLTSSNVYDTIVDIKTAMDKANVPKKDRYLLVVPDTMALILKDKDHFVKASDLGDKITETGAVGMIAGFLVIEWNDETANLKAVAGHPKYATRCKEWQVPVKLQNLDGSGSYIGASAVQGRMVYGHKVLKPSAIRALFSPANTTVSVAVGTSTAGDTKVTATLGADNSGGSLEYIKNPATAVKYGDTATDYAGTSMTSGTAKVISSCVEGDIIEVAEFNSTGACIACAYITLKASDIKAS